MNSSAELAAYTSAQLNNVFPDPTPVCAGDLQAYTSTALERLAESCKHYTVAMPELDPLHSDRYCMYLYLLSNTVWRQGGDTRLASKLFYLNKALQYIASHGKIWFATGHEIIQAYREQEKK